MMVAAEQLRDCKVRFLFFFRLFVALCLASDASSALQRFLSSTDHSAFHVILTEGDRLFLLSSRRKLEMRCDVFEV
ncbi:unnamed protein product [Sphagnum troendelagicum]